jgi:hypothetical protein
MAPVLIDVLKSIAALSSTEPKSSQRWLGELRDLVRAYLDQAAVQKQFNAHDGWLTASTRHR